MDDAQSFAAVATSLQNGEAQAAGEVFDRFSGRLIGLARTRLDGRLRGKVDPDDVIQSVFRSFFVRQREGKFELEGWDSLWSLLVMITVRKCGRQIARYKTHGRDIDREIRQQPYDEDEAWATGEAVDRDPTPLEAVMLIELVEQLMRGLNARDQEMLELRLQGYETPDVSGKVVCSERTVQRVMVRVREKAATL